PPGKSCFYSDLYDSPTQRGAFDELSAKLETTKVDMTRAPTTALAELEQLYARRLWRDIATRDFVLLSDNQVLDGVFFLEWLPKLDDAEIARLAAKLRIGMRHLEPSKVYDAFVRDRHSRAKE